MTTRPRPDTWTGTPQEWSTLAPLLSIAEVAVVLATSESSVRRRLADEADPLRRCLFSLRGRKVLIARELRELVGPRSETTERRPEPRRRVRFGTRSRKQRA